MSRIGTISEIWRYPIKSLGGELIDSAVLDRLGIPGDRRLALRNLDSGKIVSAKIPRFGRELLALLAAVDDVSGRVAVTVAADGTELGDALSEHLDRELSERLGVQVRIENATEADEVYDSYWPEVDGLALSGVQMDLPLSLMTQKGTFVDLAAMHVITTSSLERLSSLLPASVVTSSRFRPSVVIDTAGVSPSDEANGFVEKDWAGRTATLGAARLAFGTLTPRCVMTTLEQPELPADRAILQTLAKENRMTIEGLGDFAGFGVYAEVIEPGRVAIGDQLALEP